MHIQMVQNNNISTSFCAGSVNLRKIKAQNILHYDAIKKIAEEHESDIFIKKLKETKYLPASDFYIVYAKRKIDTPPFSIRGTSSAIVRKYAKSVELSAKIYNAVIQSIEDLSAKIQRITVKAPEI